MGGGVGAAVVGVDFEGCVEGLVGHFLILILVFIIFDFDFGFVFVGGVFVDWGAVAADGGG